MKKPCYNTKLDYYDDEEWYHVKIYDTKSSKVITLDNYMVSNLGRIKSYMHDKPKILKQFLLNSGYVYLCLYQDSVKHWCSIHRIVALSMIPIPQELSDYNITELEIDHRDGDKTNNTVTNLRWSTSSDNKYYAYGIGIKKQGEESPVAKYSNEQITEVCDLLETNTNIRDIYEITNVDTGTISAILSGKQWKSISSNYDFSHRKKGKKLYTVAQKELALKLLAESDRYTYADIGRMTGMTRTAVWYLVKHGYSTKQIIDQ